MRFTSKAGVNEYGTIGGDGSFVVSAKEFNQLMEQAGGDLRVVERSLGLEKGYLGNSDTVAYYIPPSELKTLRMPSGNESGANKYWIPGGKTSGGYTEAVMDLKSNDINYKEIDLEKELNE